MKPKSELPKANTALEELIDAAADADAKCLGWRTNNIAMVQIENGTTWEVCFAPDPDSPLWTATIRNMKEATPRSVGWWLTEVNNIATPEQHDMDEAEAAAERRANKPW